MGSVGVDASLVLLWLLDEDLSRKADAALQEWRDAGTVLLAPALLLAEVPSVLRQAVHSRRVTDEEGDEALQAFLKMNIGIRDQRPLVRIAWKLGRILNAPRLYDMYYLALAESEDCELWTADRRLVNLASTHVPLARWVGDFEPAESHD